MTEKLKEKIKEDKFVRRFLRALTGCILVFYTCYIVWKKFTIDEIPLDGKDWWIIIGSLAIWATWEAARSYLNNKLSK